MKCVQCGSQMKTKKENHAYRSSGLTNVVLLDMNISRCPSCHEVEVAIPAVAQLHAMLARLFVDSTTKLFPEQIRFLRKHLGWSTIRFAKKMGVDRSTAHRWETGAAPMPIPAERLLRVLVQIENPVDNYERPIELEEMGVDAPTATLVEARLRNGAWLQKTSPQPHGRRRDRAAC